MGELKNLAGMFSSVAQLIQERDAELVEKISRLEARLEELEGKLKRMEAAAAAAAVPAVAEVVEEIADSAVEDAAVNGHDDACSEIAADDVDEVAGDAGTDAGSDYAEQDSGVVAVSLEEEASPALESGEMEEDGDAGGWAEDEDLEESREILEEPEIELEFEFDDEPEVLEPEEQDLVELEPEEPEESGPEAAGDVELVMDKARPDWYDWEVDIPGPYIEDIRDGIGLNDRILFLNDLFYGDEEAFASAILALNGMDRLVEAVEYMRERYPQWNEESDEVYRFYMIVRRRFNKQIQER